MKNQYCLLFFFLICANTFCTDTVSITSSNIPLNDSVLVYFPQNYPNNQNKYPVVYLLHGLEGNYKTIGNFINLQELANRYNCLFICPDGLKNTYYLNSPANSNIRYLDFFYKDLFPVIKNLYRTDSSKYFITGYSMGGYGALLIYLQKPELFKAAGSVSGVLDLSMSLQKNKGLKDMIGPYEENKKLFDSLSITNQLESLKLNNYKILINCGTADPFYEINKKFVDTCISKNVNIIYTFEEGKHDKDFWNKALIWQLNFFSEIFFK